MGTTGWGQYIQGSDQQQEVDELGTKLSEVLHCPVHYPAFGKNLFECRCGVIFPLYLLRSGKWDMVRRKHEEERVLIA